MVPHFITSILQASRCFISISYMLAATQLSLRSVVFRCSPRNIVFTENGSSIGLSDPQKTKQFPECLECFLFSPAWVAWLEGHKQSAVCSVASSRRTGASFLTPTVTAAQREGGTSATCPSSRPEHRIRGLELELELTAFRFHIHLSGRKKQLQQLGLQP